MTWKDINILYFRLTFSVKLSHHTKLDENLEGANNFRAWKYRISLVVEENELDSYIQEEVPVPEGDESKALHKKNLVMAKRIIEDSI